MCKSTLFECVRYIQKNDGHRRFRKPVLTEVTRMAKLSQPLKDKKTLKPDCDCGKMGLDSTYQLNLQYKIRSMNLHTHDINEMGMIALEPRISITRELFQECEKSILRENFIEYR